MNFNGILTYVADGALVVEVLRLPAGDWITYHPNGEDFIMAGTIGRIQKIPRETLLNFKMYYGVPETLVRLIGYEARETSEVGGPVDIFRMTANGGEWIQNKPECRERESHPIRPSRALLTAKGCQAEDKVVDMRPPNRPWSDFDPLDSAGGFLSFYLRDELSALAVRGVTLPGNNKSDPNLETGTYGLFSICCQSMRTSLVDRRCRWVFFLTRQDKQRVLTGYYKVRWYAPGSLTQSGRPRDYAIAADKVHFVHPAIPVKDLPARARREVGQPFRIFKYVDAGVAGELVRVLRARRDATAAYVNEIERLERFNAYRTGYRYVAWKMHGSFGWDMAAKYLIPAKPTVAPAPVVPGTVMLADTWQCSQCDYRFTSKALLKRCPECGEVGTLRPATAD